MIKVTRKDYTLTVEGHAGYAEVGKDIVCAAASMLYQTLEAELKRRDIPIVNGGHTNTETWGMEINACPPHEYTFDTEIVLDTICTGYRMLAEEYPEHVTFTDES